MGRVCLATADPQGMAGVTTLAIRKGQRDFLPSEQRGGLQHPGVMNPSVRTETHLKVGVVLGVCGLRSKLRWLWTGLCAGGMSGLRAGSLREKSETALCTARE